MLIGVLVRSRPERLRRCLEGLRRASSSARIVLHLDEAEPECRQLTLESGFPLLVSEERIGIARSLNRLLSLREPREDFVRLDGDVEVRTPLWDRLLSSERGLWGMVAPVWRGNKAEAGVREWVKAPHGNPIETKIPVGGVHLTAGEVCDKLGAYRSHGGFYGCQDRDWAARVRGLGYRIAYLPSVESDHEPLVAIARGERRADLEASLKVFKRVETLYNRGEYLYERLDV